MKSAIALVLALAAGAALTAQSPELHVLPLRGNVYMLVGAGANITPFKKQADARGWNPTPCTAN